MPRRPTKHDFRALIDRVDALELETKALRREIATQEAREHELLELALAPTLTNSTLNLIEEARNCGWEVHFVRRLRRDARGSICFVHPSDQAHNKMLDFPLPEDDAKRRWLESEVRVRLSHQDAA